MKQKQIHFILLVTIATCVLSCIGGSKKKSENMNRTYEKGTFGYDLNYLSKKDSLIVLKSDDEKAQVIVSAKYQSKVFTSTTDGLNGKSLGFINYKIFDSGIVDEHMNGFGGENRFWLGPEGGKYSLYFEPGEKQVYENWHTPKAFDIEAWNIKQSSSKEVVLTKDMQLKNYKGNELKIAVERKITLIPDDEIAKLLGISIPNAARTVAYATDNKITNKNDFEWTAQTGTVCIWMLDMFNPSDSALTVVPYNQGNEKELGKVATTDYFGEIPSDRLKNENGILFLKTDGKFRSKMGINSKRTKAIAGNYDPISKRLTIITFDVAPSQTYLNQEWNPDKDPLTGDALNAYNDGPLEDGSIMGPFLELESCSPAAFLKPGESLSHKHNVYHFIGDEKTLSPICEKLLGTNIDHLKQIF